MALRRTRRKSFDRAVVLGAAVLVAWSSVGSGVANADVVLLRGENSLFSSGTVALSDSELDKSRAMGAQSSLPIGSTSPQRFSIILWDDLKRQRDPGSGSNMGTISVSVASGL